MGSRNGTFYAILASRQLSSKRYLATAEDARGPYASREIRGVRPSLTRFALVMMTRESVRTMFIMFLLLTLLRALILGVGAIFRRSFLRGLQCVVRNCVRRCYSSSNYRRVGGNIRS